MLVIALLVIVLLFLTRGRRRPQLRLRQRFSSFTLSLFCSAFVLVGVQHSLELGPYRETLSIGLSLATDALLSRRLLLCGLFWLLAFLVGAACALWLRAWWQRAAAAALWRR